MEASRRFELLFATYNIICNKSNTEEKTSNLAIFFVIKLKLIAI